MEIFDEDHSNVVLENDMKRSGYGIQQEPEIVAIGEAVKVLLQGLGEDINREGLKKTPLRVAKAFREGTREVHKPVVYAGYGSMYVVLIQSWANSVPDPVSNPVVYAGYGSGPNLTD
ncbi:hypothetical protein L1887_05730 [Cichorium endivia]|nr:hypothetical protein L1887_05730 [Cichorium endivia]